GGADDAIEVDAQRTGLALGIAHRRDMPGNQHLHRPGILVFRHGVLPDAVPVGVEVRFVGDDGVVNGAGGGDGEVVAGTVITVVVHHEVDAIHLLVEVA